MLEISPLAIADVLLIRPKRHGDERGWFSETFSLALMEKHKLPRFIQDNESLSVNSGTVRGLHFQRQPFAQAKLVRCVQGSILDIAVDIRRTSPTFGQHVETQVSSVEGEQVFVPAGFAHGFCTLEPNTVVQYKVSAPYAPGFECGIAWDDPALHVNWPFKKELVTLSNKDRSHLKLGEIDFSTV